MNDPKHDAAWHGTRGAGYDWLLNRARLDSWLTEHAAHLDDGQTDPECFYCKAGDR